MDIVISPSKISGTITAPASKSYTHRAIILASLAKGISRITNWLDSDDTRATIEACKVLGAKITHDNNALTIEGFDGKPQPIADTIDCNASGTTMRLITAVAALSETPITIRGSKRLNERPIKPLLDALLSVGAIVKYQEQEGFSPFSIQKGPRQHEQPVQEIDGNTSSQFVSALYLISPFFTPPLAIKVMDTQHSQMYIDMTRESIHTFGDGPYVAQDYEVEGDFSQASYFFAAAAITGGVVTVEGLNQTSKQGDKYLLDVLQDGGCEVEWKGNACTVSGKCTVLPASIDMGNYPDIVQTVAAIAAHIHKKTTIINIAHLAHKETDRIANTVKALNSVGVQAESDSDSITIHGGSVQGGIVETYNDHRMAMSMAVLALGASDKTEIRDAEVVNKSYPNFWTVLKTLIKTMNIVLIGMRGSGKSSVGRLLSQELDMHFVDLDEVLQREQGKKIKDIVTSEGWDAFRKYESEIVDDVKDCDNTVISTGGGVILNPENTKKLKEHGYIIWLSGGVDTLIKRIGKGANRPSLTGKPLREDLHETLKTRETLYKEASNLTIDTDDKSLEEILKEINMALKETTNND